MRLNKHFDLEGRHARLSASNYHWTNYDQDKLVDTWHNQREAARGTRLHHLAKLLIQDRVKLPDDGKTLSMYVNDCIGWRMTPEQPLKYSELVFGTADALSFRNNVLRISDLKTGITEAKVTQLEVYAAYFCLEYRIKPFELDAIELRIYQNDEIAEYAGDPLTIMMIADKAVAFDKILRQLEEEAQL